MKKEEILEKSRAEKYDEGVEMLRSKTLKITSVIILAVLIIVFISNFITGNQNNLASTIVGIFFTGYIFFVYKIRGKKKIDLLLFIFSLLMAVINTIEYFSELF